MKNKIDLGKIKIPLSEYASQGNAILGIRDSGKSYTATYLAERLLDAGISFVAFDPIGIWKYLRVSGKAKGYPVVVAGGKDGDLPLTPESAPEIVRSAMSENIPLVLDLYSMHLSKNDWKRIVEQSIRLLLYENVEHGLRHIFIEEAAEFAPQRIGPDQGRVYAEIEKLARMGGNARLGYTLINQRAEEVNKAVLELCDCLFLHRQKGRNSLTALSKWLDIGDVQASKEIIKSLPKLPQGECWIWPAGSDEPVHTKIPEKNTLHPDRRQMQKRLKQSGKKAVNVSAFVKQMSASLEKHLEEAKQNDPAELRKRIRELEKQLRDQKPAAPAKIEYKRIEIPVLNNGQLEKLGTVVERMARVVTGLQKEMAKVSSFKMPALSLAPTPAAPQTHIVSMHRGYKQSLKREPYQIRETTGELPRGEKAILSACIQFPNGLRKEQLTVLTGYKRSSRDAYIQRLRERGYVITSGNHVKATDAGIVALPEITPLPTGIELQNYWMKNLPEGERKVLEFLLSKYPNSVPKEMIDEVTGYKRSSRDAYLSRLAAKQLIVEPSRGELKANDDLF